MTGWLGRERRHLPSCGSTNDEAARWARDGAIHGAVVTADKQTAGRGRQGRVWHSPAGENLYLSCVLRPATPPARVPPLALAAGLAVSDVCRLLGVDAALKWPNDVFCGHRKLAGVLCEMSTRAGALEPVILGIGVNVGMRAFPSDLAERATSLALAGSDADRDHVLRELLEALERRIEAFLRGGVPALRGDWEARAYTGPVTVTVDGNPVTGIARRLAPDGALLLEDATGLTHRVVAGDLQPSVLQQ